MSKHLFAIAALSSVISCAAAAQPEGSHALAASSSAPAVSSTLQSRSLPPEEPGARGMTDVSRLSCDVSATPTSHGVRIEARAHAHEPARGEYSLLISKDGAAGSSDISQGGPFTVAAGAEARLGSAELNLERGAHYRAVLVLSANGAEICRHVLQS